MCSKPKRHAKKPYFFCSGIPLTDPWESNVDLQGHPSTTLGPGIWPKAGKIRIQNGAPWGLRLLVH